MGVLTNWISYQGVTVRKFAGNRAYTYRTDHVALDADGSPRAYRPYNQGLDDNRNAGYPHGAWQGVLAVDPTDPHQPYVQRKGDHVGCFVSKTSLHDATAPAIDPAAYVDAERIPYIVFPGAFYAIAGTGRFGDLVMVRTADGRHESAAIVADAGPKDAPLGEISLALASALGGSHPNARNGAGAPKGPIEYIVFPGSFLSPAWPQSFAAIDNAARACLQAMGGWPSL